MVDTAAVYNRPVLPVHIDPNLQRIRPRFVGGLLLALGICTVLAGVVSWILRDTPGGWLRDWLVRLGDQSGNPIVAEDALGTGPLWLTAIGAVAIVAGYAIGRCSRIAWVIAVALLAGYIVSAIVVLRDYSGFWVSFAAWAALGVAGVAGAVLLLPKTWAFFWGSRRPGQPEPISAVVDLRDAPLPASSANAMAGAIGTPPAASVSASRGAATRPRHSAGAATADDPYAALTDAQAAVDLRESAQTDEDGVPHVDPWSRLGG